MRKPDEENVKEEVVRSNEALKRHTHKYMRGVE